MNHSEASRREAEPASISSAGGLQAFARRAPVRMTLAFFFGLAGIHAVVAAVRSAFRAGDLSQLWVETLPYLVGAVVATVVIRVIRTPAR